MCLRAGPAQRRFVRRRVVDPDPSPAAPLRVARQLLAHRGAGRRGPSHHGQIGDRRVADLDQLAVGWHAELAHLGHPARHALAARRRARLRSWLPELTSSRVSLLQAAQVLQDDHDLRVDAGDRRDVEMIAGDDDEIEAVGDAVHPVELLQRVVQVGDQQDSHAAATATDYQEGGPARNRRAARSSPGRLGLRIRPQPARMVRPSPAGDAIRGRCWSARARRAPRRPPRRGNAPGLLRARRDLRAARAPPPGRSAGRSRSSDGDRSSGGRRSGRDPSNLRSSRFAEAVSSSTTDPSGTVVPYNSTSRETKRACTGDGAS